MTPDDETEKRRKEAERIWDEVQRRIQNNRDIAAKNENRDKKDGNR